MKQFILILIIVLSFSLAIFFRFWQFGTIPPGLNRDEASIGYTAYSILETGKDEYGTFLPISIKSFGDWKLPAYLYLTIPFIAIFGLQDWVVRLPSALAGIGTIIVLFFLARRLQFPAWISVITLALLPWHIHFSRYSLEANLALFFFSLACLLFSSNLILSSLFFGLTLFTYHSYLIFTPLFLIGLVIVYRKKITVIPIILFLSMAGIIYFATFQGAQTKSSISYITDQNLIHQFIEIPSQTGSKLIYNKPVIFSWMFIGRFVSTYLPNFLIFGADHPIHNFPGIGNIFWFQYPLFLVGLFFIIKSKNKYKWQILWCLITAPIASSLTKDAPSSVRVSMIIIPVVLLISYCLSKLNTISIIIIILFSVISFNSFYQGYFIKQPEQRALNWGAGYNQLSSYLNASNLPVIMDRLNYSPYIWFLFYSQYSPESYQQNAIRYSPTSDGFYHVQSFDRFKFENVNLSEALQKNQLVVIWAETADKKFDPYLKTIISDYGQPIFYIYEGKSNPQLIAN